MKKVLLVVTTLGLLAACSPSVKDYQEDPKLLMETLAKCAIKSDEVSSKECSTAKEAMTSK